VAEVEEILRLVAEAVEAPEDPKVTEQTAVAQPVS
jgi:hypothetical protein